MSNCASIGNSAPAKRVLMLGGRCGGVFRGGTSIKQVEQVKCIHGALSLRMHLAI